jgi:hypothetical protein
MHVISCLRSLRLCSVRAAARGLGAKSTGPGSTRLLSLSRVWSLPVLPPRFAQYPSAHQPAQSLLSILFLAIRAIMRFFAASFAAFAVLAPMLAHAATVHRDGPLARGHQHAHVRHAGAAEDSAADAVPVADAASNATALVRRAQFTNARFTNFDAGMGACGQTFSASDFVSVLLGSAANSPDPGAYSL